jgi:hypothetical protein
LARQRHEHRQHAAQTQYLSRRKLPRHVKQGMPSMHPREFATIKHMPHAEEMPHPKRTRRFRGR